MSNVSIEKDVEVASETQPKWGVFPRELEDEAIYIIREVAAQFERPALLFSGVKILLPLCVWHKRLFIQGKSLSH
jgi:sulfate adenylyltransferase subunit 2